MLAALANVPIVMVYVDGPYKILGKRAKLIVAPPYRLPLPTEGMNSEYIKDMTKILQGRMTALMNEFIKIDENRA